MSSHPRAISHRDSAGLSSIRKLIVLFNGATECLETSLMVDLLLALAFVAMILSPPILATRHRGKNHRRNN